MLPLRKGRYAARIAEGAEDLRRAQTLRNLAFSSKNGKLSSGHDFDGYDRICTHVLVEETNSGALVCCFRFLLLKSGAEIMNCYSAQFYGLSALEGFDAPMMELGRFCTDPGQQDPDILRVAWGAVTRFVDDAGVKLLFGCSSFRGTGPAAYQDAFALLSARHLAPKRWLPGVKAPDVFPFARVLHRQKPNIARALQAMPPLLRTYLLMGGWVSDHAVVDHDLGTMHVFTGLEIGAIPPVRARILRAIAGEGR